MKSFVKGTIELDKNVHDLAAYEKAREPSLLDIIDFADQLGIAIRFGTSEDDTYLVEYQIIGETKSYCRGLLSELKQKLRLTWSRPTVLFQASGNCT